MNLFAQDADTIGLSSEEREEVVEAMRSNDNARTAVRTNGGFVMVGLNNWRSCAGGHVYYVDRSFKLPQFTIAMAT